tara:strand:- start:758 stop:1042 length:285 start_codon:yes stop_codon:yes gene_type:complete
MDNYFKKGFFLGAGLLTILLILTAIYLARGLNLDKKLTAWVKEANIYKDKGFDRYLDNPMDKIPNTDFVMEQLENRVKIYRFEYMRRLKITESL